MVRGVNPITITVNALRGLCVGAPLDGEVWQGVLWIAAIVAVFAPLSVVKYRRIAIGLSRRQRAGSSTSLPVVRRACRSSCARRTSESP